MHEANLPILVATLVTLSGVIAGGRDNQGMEFILPVLCHPLTSMKSAPAIEVFFTTMSNKQATVSLTTPVFDVEFLETRTVSRGRVEVIKVPTSIRGTKDTSLTYRSIYIVSTKPIVAYVVNKQENSNDAYMAIPIDALGRLYYILTYQVGSTFGISAYISGTKVKVTFPVEGHSTIPIKIRFESAIYRNGDTIEFTMKKFHAFHCSPTVSVAGGDLTGTIVESDQPVAVVAGNLVIAVPPVRNYQEPPTLSGIKTKPHVSNATTSDHLTEMMVPFESWGKEYFFISTPGRYNGDYLRIMAGKEDTIVSIQDTGGPFQIEIAAGKCAEYQVASGNLMTIKSKKGILAGLFSKSFAEEGVYDGITFGDPSFTLLISRPLFAAAYVFTVIKRPDGTDYNNFLVTVVAEANREGLILDDIRVVQSLDEWKWQLIPGSGGFISGSVAITPTDHELYHEDPSKTVMAIVFGNELYTSYAFAAGQRLTAINKPCKKTKVVPFDLLDNDCDGNIDEESKNGVDDDGDGLIDEDLAQAPRVDGKWGLWSAFSSCNTTCKSAGVRSRYRHCDNPAPANDGKDCRAAEHTQSSRCAPLETCNTQCKYGLFLTDEMEDAEFEIIPHQTCFDTASKKVWVGYSNFGTKTVSIPVGVDNKVAGAEVEDQSTVFWPGHLQYGFQVGPIEDKSTVTWTLVNRLGGSKRVLTVDLKQPIPCPNGLENVDTNEQLSKTGYCLCHVAYYGASCQSICPGGVEKPCSYHGICRRSDGACVCESRWAGEIYELNYYTQGFVSANDRYVCGKCSMYFLGPDCMAGQVFRNKEEEKRHNETASHFAAAFGSDYITLDGAAMTLTTPGAYRLLQTDILTVDAFYEKCYGRHDCRRLGEVSLRGGSITISLALDETGKTIIKTNGPQGISLNYPFERVFGNIHVLSRARDVLRFKVMDGPQAMVANVNWELVVGVSVPRDYNGVTGLLGNADGNWWNDLSDELHGKLSMEDVGKMADRRFKPSPEETTLLQSDVTKILGKAGFALKVAPGKGAVVSGHLPLRSQNSMSLELWAKIPNPAQNTATLANMVTSLGSIELACERGGLVVNWDGNVYISKVKVAADIWTYVTVSWENSNGTVRVHAIVPTNTNATQSNGTRPDHAEIGDGQGGDRTFYDWSDSTQALVSKHSTDGFKEGETLTSISSLTFGGGGTDTEFYIDYIRFFIKNRQASEMLKDYRTYTRKTMENQRLLVLLDEGISSEFQARVDTVSGNTTWEGTLPKQVTWADSTVPVNEVRFDPLPPIVAHTAAVSWCEAEVNSTVFTSLCSNLSGTRQVVMEHCVKEYIRTGNAHAVKVSGSVFAYYCLGVTAGFDCYFKGYLDFCVGMKNPFITAEDYKPAMVPLIGGLLLLASMAGMCLFALLFAGPGHEEEEEGEWEDEGLFYGEENAGDALGEDRGVEEGQVKVTTPALAILNVFGFFKSKLNDLKAEKHDSGDAGVDG